jgi:hypothetical protein
MNKYLKFTYWNTCDLGNVIYTNSFQHWFFLDALVTEPEELKFEEIEKDGNEKDIKTFIRTVKRYKIVTPQIPEYMVDAINRMVLHDNIELTFLNGETLTLTKDQISVSTEYVDGSTCFALVTIQFDVDETVLKTACCVSIKTTCLVEEDCDVTGVLFAPHHNFYDDVIAEYSYAATGQLYLIIAPFGANTGYGSYGVQQLTIVPGAVTWTPNQCTTEWEGKLILTAEGEFWYNDGYYWYRINIINHITTIAGTPPNTYNTVFKGRVIPGTFVQLQGRQSINPNWTNIGSPVTADDFFSVGISHDHSLSGLYYFRVVVYNYNCNYTSYAVQSDLVSFA